jgi:hypothetical protein
MTLIETKTKYPQFVSETVDPIHFVMFTKRIRFLWWYKRKSEFSTEFIASVRLKTEIKRKVCEISNEYKEKEIIGDKSLNIHYQLIDRYIPWHH